MATSREFVDFILDQCAGLPVRTRSMMGEYLLYYRDKLAASLCDNRMLVKDLPAARALMRDAVLEPPYPGAKDMLVVERLDDRAFLAELLEAVYPELPMAKPRKGKKA
ncbi:MAG: competence protein TfoX [Clostridia bacterium]|nr:competence protein TfoX [Clostridia bacterium]MBP3653166.1 competence protein TfoX [Clostridia bacterium]